MAPLTGYGESELKPIAIVDPDAPTALGDHYPEIVSQLPIPFLVFVNEAKATAFLRDGIGPKAGE